MHARATKEAMSGRPPKFNEPSRAVTVTLPLRTLDLLQTIDQDRAKAIVKAAKVAAGTDAQNAAHCEVVEMAPGVGLLVVPPSRTLRSISWLRMIEIAPARYLLTLLPGTSIEKVELSLIDLVETARRIAPQEAPLIEELRQHVRHLRRGEKITKAEILFVDTTQARNGAKVSSVSSVG